MATIGFILLGIGSIASIICWIMVLIQLFQKEGTGLGILGIFCNIYTYIWGWIKSKELGLKNLMLGWTAAIIVSMIGYGLVVAGMVTNPKFQQQLQDAQLRSVPEGAPAGSPP
jgi:hypothetical protein